MRRFDLRDVSLEQGHEECHHLQHERKSGSKEARDQVAKDIKALEKIDPEAAAKEYSVHAKEGAKSPESYKRAAILYRKLNMHDEEVNILNLAIENLTKLNPGKEEWFIKRLDKLTA